MTPKNTSPKAAPSPKSLSPAGQAALVLVHIHAGDPSLAQYLLSRLDRGAATRVLREMSRLGSLDLGNDDQVLDDFLAILVPERSALGTSTARGSIDGAKQALLKSMQSRLSPDDPFWKDQALDHRLSHIQSLLADMPERSIQDFLRAEHPQVATLILALAKPATAARILKAFAPEQATAQILRLASLEDVSSEALEELDVALSEFQKKQSQGRSLLPEGGVRKVSQLLGELDGPFRESLLVRLSRDADPRSQKLSDAIRSDLLTFEKVTTMLQKDLARVLSPLSDDQLALALVGETNDLQERVLSAVSSRRRSAIEDALADFSPSSPLRPNQKAQKSKAHQDMIARANELHASGEVFFPWEETLVS